MNIILGITGSVSAYKAPWLVRDLQRAGHSVRVVMSESAANFVTPLALQAVSKHSVVTNPFSADIQEGGSWHVHWAEWCDAMIIAPCSATTLGKMCAGISDSSVLLVAASMPAVKVMVCPAMDADMWHQPSTQRNVKQLMQDGCSVVEPESGSLASGLEGVGRLPELDNIVKVVNQHFANDSSYLDGLDHVGASALAGLHCVVTAGPTVEPIDAVRSIINHSSGQMGYAIAESLRNAGALVTLISGPVTLPAPPGVNIIRVRTASDMLRRVMEHSNANVIVMAAAVADFTPLSSVSHKIKKDSLSTEQLSLQLKPTVDILKTLGAQKQSHQTIVGFALETEDLIQNATAKLYSKNADMIVANKQGDDTGLGVSTNQVTIITAGAPVVNLPLMDKPSCAAAIVHQIQNLLVLKSKELT
jgi:phosphopantothenoylcysteine decarboxylase / phosphopantothenate---cysteine ligase